MAPFNARSSSRTTPHQKGRPSNATTSTLITSTSAPSKRFNSTPACRSTRSTIFRITEESSTINTRKGFIFEKSNPGPKIRIRKGEVIETRGKETIRRRSYHGREILDLRDAIASGRLKFRKGEYIEYRPWNSPDIIRGIMDEESFLDMMEEYERDMSERTFTSFLDYTEVYFIRS